MFRVFKTTLVMILTLLATVTIARAEFDDVHGTWVISQAARRGIKLISAERAENIGMRYIGRQGLVLKEIDLKNEADDYPNGTDFRPVYEMEFLDRSLPSQYVIEYEIDVDAVTGEILKVEQDDAP